MIRIYRYQKCSTCQKALKWLDERGVNYDLREIKETPPSDQDLEAMLAAQDGGMRKLFNTSGMDYREMGLKDKVPTLSKAEAFALLQRNGMLVKRPFLIGDGKALLGFREKEWAAQFE